MADLQSTIHGKATQMVIISNSFSKLHMAIAAAEN